MKDRKGKFYVASILLENHYDAIMKIMGRCVITKCEHLFHNEQFEYFAISPDFDELLPGEITPVYEVKIDEIIDVRTLEIIDHKVKFYRA